MSQHQKNTEDKIREKLQAHEFDFSPAAWEQMEEMLDDPSPALGGAAKDLSLAPGWSSWLKGGLFVGVLLLTALITWYLKAKTAVDLIEHTELHQGNLSNNSQEQTPKAQQSTEKQATLEAQQGQQKTKENTLSALPGPTPNISSLPAESPAAAQSARKLTPGAMTGSAITGFSKQRSAKTQTSVSSAAQSLSRLKTAMDQPPRQRVQMVFHPADASPKDFSSSKPEAAAESGLAIGQPSQPAQMESNSQASFGSLEEIPLLFTPLEKRQEQGQRLLIQSLGKQFKNRIQLGFSIGMINNNTVSNNFEIPFVRGQIDQSKRRFFSLGLLARFPLDEVVSLQAELNYYRLKSQYEIRGFIVGDELNAIGDVPIDILSIPLMVQFSLGHGLRITGGGAVNLNWVKGTGEDIGTVSPNFNEIYLLIRESYKDRQLQGMFIAGIGYDWRRFSADLRYERYLGSITNTPEYESEEYRLRTRSSNVSLRFSYRFDARRLLGR